MSELWQIMLQEYHTLIGNGEPDPYYVLIWPQKFGNFVLKGVYTSTAHIPEKEIIIADPASREFQKSHAWMLYLEVFKYLVELFQLPDIDMFLVSRLNNQVPKFASWMPNPESYISDRMSTSWENTCIYAFPPISMIWPTLSKIEKEAEKAILIAIVAIWPTQTWFTRALELTAATTII